MPPCRPLTQANCISQDSVKRQEQRTFSQHRRQDCCSRSANFAMKAAQPLPPKANCTFTKTARSSCKDNDQTSPTNCGPCQRPTKLLFQQAIPPLQPPMLPLLPQMHPSINTQISIQATVIKICPSQNTRTITTLLARHETSSTKSRAL